MAENGSFTYACWLAIIIGEAKESESSLVQK